MQCFAAPKTSPRLLWDFCFGTRWASIPSVCTVELGHRGELYSLFFQILFCALFLTLWLWLILVSMYWCKMWVAFFTTVYPFQTSSELHFIHFKTFLFETGSQIHEIEPTFHRSIKTGDIQKVQPAITVMAKRLDPKRSKMDKVELRGCLKSFP